MKALAHVKQMEGGGYTEHLLDKHLLKVGDGAKQFAAIVGSGKWAELAGRWHDLGKYSREFQGYIRTASGYDRQQAHVEALPGRVDHSTAGAI
ncbi:CRISPR-associated endonuclease Cas3'', partial [Thiolapillus sp.]